MGLILIENGFNGDLYRAWSRSVPHPKVQKVAKPSTFENLIRRPSRRVSFPVCLDHTYTCTLILRYTHVYVAYTIRIRIHIRKRYDVMDRGTREGGEGGTVRTVTPPPLKMYESVQ